MAKEKKAIKEVHTLYEKLSQIKGALAESADGLSGQAGELITKLVNDVKSKAAEQQENIGEYAGTNPLRTIGMSVLAGALLTLLIKK